MSNELKTLHRFDFPLAQWSEEGLQHHAAALWSIFGDNILRWVNLLFSLVRTKISMLLLEITHDYDFSKFILIMGNVKAHFIYSGNT